MTIHHVAIPAKNGLGTDIPGGIRQHDTSGTNAGPNVPEQVLVDTTGAEILGTQADVAVSDPLQSGSVIAFIKGLLVPFGQKTDAKAGATDSTPVSFISLFKQISFSIQNVATSLTNPLTVGTHAVTGSGNFASTVNDGANTTLGAKADARNTATDTTPVSAMSVFKQISFSIQAAVTALGALVSATPGVGRTVAISSSPVALSTEDKTALDLVATNQSNMVAQETALNTVIGIKADPKSAATDTTAVTAMSVWKQISFSIQASAASLASLVSSVVSGSAGTPATQVLSVQGIASMTPLSITSVVTAASNGCISSRVNSAATTNTTLMKASAGNITEIDVFNNAAYTVFLKFYNKAATPTLGSDTPVWTIPVAPGGGYSKSFPRGKSFNIGMSYAITKLQSDTDNTAVLAGDLTGSIDWI
jgi:hypothetical protein